MDPYIPEKLPIEDFDYRRLFKFVGEANAELARYDGLLQGIVNPAVLLSPLTTQEAVLSSKIEGTQATLDEVLEHEAGMDVGEEKTKDIQEIVNYRSALTAAKEFLADRPITLHILREMHKILLTSVRGYNKSPGEFRKDQNWIGRAGCSQEEATFVSPNPLEMKTALDDWAKYVGGNDPDLLVQLAVVHAQFELIHPFKDGNGRIGRLLIPLFLFQKKKLSSPMFYLSEYLEEHRDEYYDRLRAISDHRDWNSWIVFFLEAVRIQSSSNAIKVRNILELYEHMKARIVEITHSHYSMQLMDALFDRPIFQTSDFVKRTGIPKQSAMPLLRQVREAGFLQILRESSGRRPAILAFGELLNIAEGKKVL